MCKCSPAVHALPLLMLCYSVTHGILLLLLLPSSCLTINHDPVMGVKSRREALVKHAYLYGVWTICEGE